MVERSPDSAVRRPTRQAPNLAPRWGDTVTTVRRLSSPLARTRPSPPPPAYRTPTPARPQTPQPPPHPSAVIPGRSEAEGKGIQAAPPRIAGPMGSLAQAPLAGNDGGAGGNEFP